MTDIHIHGGRKWITLEDWPQGHWDILLVDPPWAFSGNSVAKPSKNVRKHYDTMTIEELVKLPVQSLVGKHALMLMWTTAPLAERAFEVVRAWGFRYKSQLVWPKNRIATGHWVRGQHELVYLCRRGTFPCPTPAPFPSSILPGAVRQHSRKPDSLHEAIDKAWPNARKLELFGRQDRPGWNVWGNQVTKFAQHDGDTNGPHGDGDSGGHQIPS